MPRFLIYDIGGKLVAEYGGLQSNDEGGVKYTLQDWQGSARAIVSNSGFVNSRADYTAFGEEIGSGTGLRTAAQGFGNSSSLRQKYGLTERDDATGLDHTWFRKHENRAGRWTSPDPYNGSMSLGNPQSFNRYSYVENEPTNFVDPTGLQIATVCRWERYGGGWWDEDDNYHAEEDEWRLVCTTIFTTGGGSGNSYPDAFVPGGGTTTPIPTSGGGKQGECERIVAFIERLIAAFDREIDKYDPVADYWGGKPWRHGGRSGTTKSGGHYNKIRQFQNALQNRIEEWKRTCNDRFGGPPLVPLPAGAESRADERVTAPHQRSIWDILPTPPTKKQIEDFYLRRGPVFPLLPRRVPVF